MTDSEYINMLEEDPDRAYSLMIDQYGNLVYAIVLNKLKNISSREDIEDCVSDIFVEIFQNYKKFSCQNGTLKAFISTIAKRTAIDEYRRLTKKYSRAVSIDEDNADDFFTDETPEKKTAEKSEKKLIWEIIQNLGEPDSIILIQQFFYDKTVKETAKFLSMTAAAVLSSIRKEKNNIHVSPEQTSALTTASSETSYETSEPAPKTSQTTVSEVSETSTDTAATRTVTSVYAVSGTAAETVPVEVTEIQPAEITEINQEPEKNYQEYFDYLHEFFTDEYICQYYTDDYNPFIEYDGKTF